MAVDCEQIDDLLSGYLDGELTQGKQQLVEVHVSGCAQCTSRLKELEKVRASVAGLHFETINPNDWRQLMNDATVRTTRVLGWLLLVGGALALVGFGIYEWLLLENEPPVVKWGIAALYLGFAVLFLSVLRQRLIARKTDKYKDVEI